VSIDFIRLVDVTRPDEHLTKLTRNDEVKADWLIASRSKQESRYADVISLVRDLTIRVRYPELGKQFRLHRRVSSA
jgi:hypothetical protein